MGAQAAGAPAVAASLVYLAGSLVCHQRPDRSFHLAAVQLPVCARCTGLYLGGAIGAIGWLLWRRRRSPADAQIPPRMAMLALIVAAAPTAITAATAWVGIADASNQSRAALAFPLGVVAGVVLAAVASNDLS